VCNMILLTIRSITVPFENDDVYEGVSETVIGGNIKFQGNADGDDIVLTIAKSETAPEQYFILTRQDFVGMVNWGAQWIEQTSIEELFNFDDE